MISKRDGHVRVLPLNVANKIAAGEVVERPASVAKELVENAIDAGARSIRIVIASGGAKLVMVQDDGCGMTREDAVLSLERQATSKILDVDDIEHIDTLGFRGEAIPSIASVSRFSITTRRHDSDEGVEIKVNAGNLESVESAGCPPGTIVEVRDIFCNVPVRKKFMRSRATEEGHIKTVFTVSALAHPDIAFSLSADGRELYRLAPASSVAERTADIFGRDFLENMLRLDSPEGSKVKVTGLIERPDRDFLTRRDQYIFVNGRPATAPAIAYALKEAYPGRRGDARPAAVIFIELPPVMVDVNVHPTKREVRFTDNNAVKNAVIAAVEGALFPRRAGESASAPQRERMAPIETPSIAASTPAEAPVTESSSDGAPSLQFSFENVSTPPPESVPQPTALEFAVEPDSTASKPWTWFKYLAQTASGYLLIETDAGVVTVNPHAARERIAFEQLLAGENTSAMSQRLLIAETTRLSPPDFARIKASLPQIASMGFQIEEFGSDTFKIDAVPQLIGELDPGAVLTTIAHDLAEGVSRRGGEKWREELIAKSIARSFAGANVKLTEEGAVKLVEELCSCSMPYVCPRGKPVMIFTSTRELNRKFDRV